MSSGRGGDGFGGKTGSFGGFWPSFIGLLSGAGDGDAEREVALLACEFGLEE